MVPRGPALAGAVDELLARVRVPLVDAVARIRREVGAVHVLQRHNVVHHQRLRVARTLDRIAVRRTADIGLGSHYGVFKGVVIVGQRGEAALRLMAVFETERVSQLMDHRPVGVGAADRIVVVSARVIEPNVPADPFGIIGRIIAPSGAGSVGQRQAQISVRGGCLGHLAEADVGDRRVHRKDRDSRRLLGRIQHPEVRRRLIVGAVADRVEASGARKAVGEVPRGPPAA